MNKKFLYFAMLLMVVIPFITSCNLVKSSDSELPEGKYEFYGMIEPDEKIEMSISVDKEGKIEGSYRPVSKNDGKSTSYNLQGSVFDKNKVTLYVTEPGGNQPIQTFNIFATIESEHDISFKGTINDNQSQKVSNVSLSTNKSLIDNLQAPRVATSKKEQNEQKEEKKRLVNHSPYPIAPGNHKFKGKAEGKWPIVVYINVSQDGEVTGKMAYESTLKKYGDTSDRYMQLYGYFSGKSLHLTSESSHGEVEEWDLNCSDNGYNYKLKGWAYNYDKDKEFSIDVKGE